MCKLILVEKLAYIMFKRLIPFRLFFVFAILQGTSTKQNHAYAHDYNFGERLIKYSETHDYNRKETLVDYS